MIGSYILWVTLVTQAGDISQHSQVFADKKSCEYGIDVEMDGFKKADMLSASKFAGLEWGIRSYSLNCIPYKREEK